MDFGSDEHTHGHGCDGGGDVSEWKKVAELRAVVEAQDPASKVLYLVRPSTNRLPPLLLVNFSRGSISLSWFS
jgi:hypothetical protein